MADKRRMTPAQKSAYTRSVNAAKRAYKKFLEKQETEMVNEEREAKMVVENVRFVISNSVNEASTPFTRDGMMRSADIILSIIDESVATWGYVDTAKNIKRWAMDFGAKLKRLVQAVVDTKGAARYNTNAYAFKADDRGNIGRARYTTDIRALAKALKVGVGRLLETQ